MNDRLSTWEDTGDMGGPQIGSLQQIVSWSRGIGPLKQIDVTATQAA